MASIITTSPKSHNQNYTLQKYLLLQSQAETLHNHIYQIQSGAMSAATVASTATSPATSPIRGTSKRHHSSSRSGSGRRQPPFPSSPRGASRRRDSDLETVLDESSLFEVAAEQQRLFDVNEGIKRALTELLNCEAVRADQSFRTWVQCRLMETERELRSGRRRRSMVME